MKNTLLHIFGLMLLAYACSFAQDQQQPSTATPGIDKRQATQQERISKGVQSGQLTAGEAARLERGEAKIEKQKEKAQASGNVTPAQKKKLNRELNRESRKIKRLKHNDKTAPPAAPAPAGK